MKKITYEDAPTAEALLRCVHEYAEETGKSLAEVEVDFRVQQPSPWDVYAVMVLD